MLAKACSTILEAIGHTPLVKLNRVARGVAATIYVKCEYINPGGSMKDRMTLHMVNQAEARGELRAGGTIIEATSGNTGAGLAMIAAVRGYQCVFVMPDKMSNEKIASLKAFGARVVVCPTAVEPEDPRSYYSVAQKLHVEMPNSFHATNIITRTIRTDTIDPLVRKFGSRRRARSTCLWLAWGPAGRWPVRAGTSRTGSRPCSWSASTRWDRCNTTTSRVNRTGFLGDRIR